MTEQPPQQHQGVIDSLTDLGKSLVKSLPPAFIMLVLINVVFLGMILWFLNTQLTQRTALVQQLVDKCMEIALKAPPPNDHH